jgi:hypothetical protein
MFWQGVIWGFLGKSSGNESDSTDSQLIEGVVAGGFAFEA